MRRTHIILLFVVLAGGYFSWQLLLTHPGKQLFHDPSFANSRNRSSCANCHDNGSRLGKIGKKTSYLINGQSFQSVEAVIDETMIPLFLNGEPIGKSSQQMKDLVDYLEQLTNDK